MFSQNNYRDKVHPQDDTENKVFEARTESRTLNAWLSAKDYLPSVAIFFAGSIRQPPIIANLSMPQDPPSPAVSAQVLCHSGTTSQWSRHTGWLKADGFIKTQYTPGSQDILLCPCLWRWGLHNVYVWHIIFIFLNVGKLINNFGSLQNARIQKFYHCNWNISFPASPKYRTTSFAAPIPAVTGGLHFEDIEWNAYNGYRTTDTSSTNLTHSLVHKLKALRHVTSHT